MTASPEERAEEVLRALEPLAGLVSRPRQIALIASVIRQAEQDALADAESEVRRYADNFHSVSKHRSALITAIVTIQQVAALRSLKKD